MLQDKTINILYNKAVMEVSRPDFMGLGLVWVSSLKGLVSVLRFKGLGLSQDYSVETTRPEGKQMKIES